MALNHERYMRLAIDEAAKSGAEGNLAVGSVIVQDDRIVAAGRNLASSTNDPTAHAETVALREAGAALGRRELSGCTLYTTFQPCPMCCGALMVSDISTLVMGGRPDPADNRYGVYTVEWLLEQAAWAGKMEVVTGVLVEECHGVRQKWEAKTPGSQGGAAR